MEEYLLNIVLAIIELTNIILCYAQILRVKVTKKVSKIALWYVGIVVFISINWYCGVGIPVAVLNMVYGLVTVWMVTECKVIHAVGLYLCAYMIESIINTEISYMYAMLVNVPQFELSDKIVNTIMMDSSFCTIIVFKLFIENISKKKREHQYTFGNSMYVALYLGSFSFMLILSAVNYFGERFNIPYNQTNLLGFLLTTVCIIFYVLFFWLAISIHNNETYQKEKDMMQLYAIEQDKYINLVVEKDADMRSFRHDLKEQMDVISGLLSRNEYDEAHRYIDKLYEHYNKAVIEKYTGDMAVDAIISQKKIIMDDEEIEFKWNGSDLSIPNSIEVYDMCTLFINILNNAIEACRGLEVSDRYIEVEMRITGENVYIMERNKVIRDVEFDSKGNPVSSKDDKKNHGFGSKNIRHTVEKYKGVLLYSIVDGIFTLEVKV